MQVSNIWVWVWACTGVPIPSPTTGLIIVVLCLVGVIYCFPNKCTIFSSRGVVFYFIFHELSFLLEVDQEVKNYCF